MSINLKITSKIKNNMPVLDLDGEIDVYTYPKLNEILLELIKEKYYCIVINMEKIKYIDSTGLGVLANCVNKIAPKNGELRIVCTNTQLTKIFSVSGLTNKNLLLFSDEKSALKK